MLFLLFGSIRLLSGFNIFWTVGSPSACSIRSSGYSVVRAVSTAGYGRGAFHFLWSDGCGAASPPIKQVGPSVVFNAAFGGEEGVGARFRPATPRPLEPAPDDLLAGAFHDAGSDRQPVLPAKVAGIRLLLASKQSMQAATASSRSRCGFRSSMTRATCPSSDCCLILSIRPKARFAVLNATDPAFQRTDRGHDWRLHIRRHVSEMNMSEIMC